ncbi:MAG TPA: OsmC family protein [Terriglobales bacterium]|jgi:organic hydroperoxide reductase OsmC/OhrA|nr:OsmC family protein [Terriglobales bacterium]
MEEKKTYRKLQFENTVSWTSGRRGSLSAAEHPSLEVGSPPAFNGAPDVWCPEDLLIGALNTCLMLTFLAVARRRDVPVVAYESGAQGTLEHSEEPGGGRGGRKYRVTRVKVRPMVSLPEGANLAAAEEVTRETLASCIITNSLSATVEFVPEFRSGSDKAA